MRRCLVEHIEGLPPKKDGANSMWNKPVETPRLIALRTGVLEQLGPNSEFTSNISIKLRLYVDTRSNSNVGDLDNFIAGICDGLQAVHSRAKLDETWKDPRFAAIHPLKVIAILNDAEVISIDAKKYFEDSCWYSIEISGE